MPIVKCSVCGKMGFEVMPKDAHGEGLVWLKGVVCRHCGKRSLVRAVFGKDYGYREDGTRFGNGREGFTTETQRTQR